MVFNNSSRDARLFVNNSPSSVEVRYSLEQAGDNNVFKAITIRNLVGLPPFIRFLENSDSIATESSSNGLEWTKHTGEESQQVQIYRLFDPNIILPIAKIQKARISIFRERPKLERIQFEGKYSTHNLFLPDQVKKFFWKCKETVRWLRVEFFNEELLFMAQKDFPPFKDTLNLMFVDDLYSPYEQKRYIS
jgi:hypothetical protein